MKLKSIFSILFYLIFAGFISAQNRQQINSVEDVCKVYPDKMETIFQNLNLDYKGLENVKKAYLNGNLSKACGLLLEYYISSESAKRLKKEQPLLTQKTTPAADSIIRDIYTFQNVAGQVPRLENGHLKWSHNGPEDDIEWAWALNRHYPVAYLLPDYYETGNPDYARYIDSFTKDWIIQSWPYPAVKSSTAIWRGLEVSFRVKTWAQVFFGLMNTDFISPATKLLILSSLPDHAHYARYFHAQNNWLTMEISGLTTVATAWPEFKQAEEWLNYSIDVMAESMKDQVYADGAQTELTSSYHYVALLNFELFKNLCNDAGKSLPEFFDKTLEEMYNYLALTIRPDGNGLLNNDADLMYNRDIVLKAAETYNRSDWKYIATNGKEGMKPKDGPSFIFPWAGQLISRSGYDANAQWSFFDMGPWGSGHQHNDKLHLSVSAFGRDLLVDAGRFAYTGAVAEKFRPYAKGTQGHNSVLIDGKGQQPDVLVTDKPLSEKHWKITPEFDYAWNSFDKYIEVKGEVKHTRALFYVRDNFWVIADSIKTDRPRKIDVLWHWHPECNVLIAGDLSVSTQNERGNLKIIPSPGIYWDVKNVKGVEDSELQGWYSEEYNKYEPNVATIYSTTIEKDAVFFWTLIPYEFTTDEFAAGPLSVGPLGGAFAVVQKNKGSWKLTIPFSDSSKANLDFKK